MNDGRLFSAVWQLVCEIFHKYLQRKTAGFLNVLSKWFKAMRCLGVQCGDPPRIRVVTFTVSLFLLNTCGTVASPQNLLQCLCTGLCVADPPRASGRVFEYPDVLGLFWGQMVYSLKLKFRPERSVIGEEGPALDTALEGTLPSFKKIRRGFSLLTGLTPQNMKSIHVLTSSIDPCWKY